jgi:hypothetical protein
LGAKRLGGFAIGSVLPVGGNQKVIRQYRLAFLLELASNETLYPLGSPFPTMHGIGFQKQFGRKVGELWTTIKLLIHISFLLDEIDKIGFTDRHERKDGGARGASSPKSSWNQGIDGLAVPRKPESLPLHLRLKNALAPVSAASRT